MTLQLVLKDLVITIALGGAIAAIVMAVTVDRWTPRYKTKGLEKPEE